MTDSHTGRMYPYRRWLGEHLRQVPVCSFVQWRGGAVIERAEQQVGSCAGFQLEIFMIGGNDLVNGCTASKLADRMRTLAQEILREQADRVVIPFLRPRSNVAYNSLACQYASPWGERLDQNPP